MKFQSKKEAIKPALAAPSGNWQLNLFNKFKDLRDRFGWFRMKMNAFREGPCRMLVAESLAS